MAWRGRDCGRVSGHDDGVYRNVHENGRESGHVRGGGGGFADRLSLFRREVGMSPKMTQLSASIAGVRSV